MTIYLHYLIYLQFEKLIICRLYFTNASFKIKHLYLNHYTRQQFTILLDYINVYSSFRFQ